MFKGAKEYNKDKGNTIWSVLQRVGAQVNATTWLVRTYYYELLPSEHLEEAIKIEVRLDSHDACILLVAIFFIYCAVLVSCLSISLACALITSRSLHEAFSEF